MRAIGLLSLILYILVFTGCEEDYTLPSNNDYKEKIVVNSVFHSDSSWQIKLTSTRNIFKSGSQIRPITDATVSILDKNGQTVSSLSHINNGLYTSRNSFPKQNEIYTLVIYSPTYGSVRSSSRIPVRAQVTDLEIVQPDEIEEKYLVNFKINDANPERNYYLWELITIGADQLPGSNSGNEGFHFDVNRWVTNLDRQIQHIRNNKIKSDLIAGPKNFNGGTHTTSVIAYSDLFKTGFGDSENDDNNEGGIEIVDPEGGIKGVKTYLRVMTMSEDLYQYFRSVENYLFYRDHNSSLVEPVDVYHNIDGGIGIFAGYSVVYIPLEL